MFRRTERTEGYRLTADLESQTLTDVAGLKISFTLDAFRRDYLLKGLDEIGLTLRREDCIAAYENSHRPAATMYGPVRGHPSASIK